MATNPSFIATPVIGVGSVSTANTARDGSGTLVTVVPNGSTGIRILEVVIKATADPADSVVTLFLHDGTNAHLFDEIDIGNPADGSAAVETYRVSRAYANLVLPVGWSLRAAITAAPTSGVVKVFALGGAL